MKSGLVRAIWQKNHYFFWVWVVLTIIVVIGYETQFDRERVCAYQYCPSTLVVALGSTCLVLAIVWVNIFFTLLRPMLQLWVGKLIGTRVEQSGVDTGILETLLAGNTEELWVADKEASVLKQVLVAAADFICIIVLLVLPMTAIIAGASGLAYVEEHFLNSPPGAD